MYGFTKYLIIIGIAILVLWMASIMIYWDVIGTHLQQAINELVNSGMTLAAYIFVFALLLATVFGSIRG